MSLSISNLQFVNLHWFQGITFYFLKQQLTKRKHWIKTSFAASPTLLISGFVYFGFIKEFTWATFNFYSRKATKFVNNILWKQKFRNTSWSTVRPSLSYHISGFISGYGGNIYFWSCVLFFEFLQIIPVLLLFNNYDDFSCIINTSIPGTEANRRPCQWCMMEFLAIFLKRSIVDI